MIGVVVWWNQRTTSGVVAVTENGTVRRYFLLASRILSSPEVIESGDLVEFSGFTPAVRPDLLPVASGVRITKNLNDAGAAALAWGEQK